MNILEELKVQNDLQYMLRKVILFDIILALILGGTTYYFFKNYVFIVLFGLSLAIISFVLNGIITEYILLKKTGKYKTVALISYLIKIVTISGIAVILFNQNKLNVIAYMLGYSSHFISLTLYGISLKNQ